MKKLLLASTAAALVGSAAFAGSHSEVKIGIRSRRKSIT